MVVSIFVWALLIERMKEKDKRHSLIIYKYECFVPQSREETKRCARKKPRKEYGHRGLLSTARKAKEFHPDESFLKRYEI
jgi:hypothetical protein